MAGINKLKANHPAQCKRFFVCFMDVKSEKSLPRDFDGVSQNNDLSVWWFNVGIELMSVKRWSLNVSGAESLEAHISCFARLPDL